MTTPATIDRYGGHFSDLLPVEDPTTEISADYFVRLSTDASEMTRTTDKIMVRFATTVVAAPVAVEPIMGRSHMGTGSGDLPTISKVGTGLYDITYPTSYTNQIGALENIVFVSSDGDVKSLSTAGSVQTTEVGPLIHVAVFSASGAASDLGGGAVIQVTAK